MAKLVGARVYNDANISIANNTEVALTFNQERYDTDAIHDTGSNTSRLTCKTAGKYIISGSWKLDANSTSYRYISIKLNGTTGISFHLIDASTISDFMAIATIYELAVDEYVELICLQNSGGALNVLTVGNYSPEFAMQRIG
jgi:hypothetical protein